MKKIISTKVQKRMLLIPFINAFIIIALTYNSFKVPINTSKFLGIFFASSLLATPVWIISMNVYDLIDMTLLIRFILDCISFYATCFVLGYVMIKFQEKVGVE